MQHLEERRRAASGEQQELQRTVAELGVSVDAFAGAQATYQLGVVAFVFELRGSLAAMQTPSMNGSFGGVSGLLGVRIP